MKVAIIGVGLIGGSIGLAARRRAGAQVCGYDPDERVAEKALALGAIETRAPDVTRAVADADIAFVATPVGALPETVRLALQGAGRECVVSDVGSTKRVVADAGADERFIGGHPLAGSEASGIGHARADLFREATWYLTPGPRSSGVLYERLHSVLVAFGARPVATDAETHDRMMAVTSQLPHVLANVMLLRAAEQASLDRSGPGIGPSLRDATRVAGANPAIWPDIFASNAETLSADPDEKNRRPANGAAPQHAASA